MPKYSIYKEKLIQEKKKKALLLYRQGLSSREVGKIIGRSHEWVLKVVKELLSTSKT